jgi:hypothetical protein
MGSKDKKIRNSLTIANVRGRLKMNTFRGFRNFFLALAALSGGRLVASRKSARPVVACRAFSLRPARRPVANAGIKYLDCYLSLRSRKHTKDEQENPHDNLSPAQDGSGVMRGEPRIAGFQHINNAWRPLAGLVRRVGPIRIKACRGPLRLAA